MHVFACEALLVSRPESRTLESREAEGEARQWRRARDASDAMPRCLLELREAEDGNRRVGPGLIYYRVRQRVSLTPR